jgi:hypothetical protein
MPEPTRRAGAGVALDEQVGHADSEVTLDIYMRLEQRAERDRGRSFDRLIRQVRDLHVEVPDPSDATQLALKAPARKSTRPGVC